jgi:hypothetical protein
MIDVAPLDADVLELAVVEGSQLARRRMSAPPSDQAREQAGDVRPRSAIGHR